ncbi:hypothetical protein [Streptomyces mobaraensis]|uniref:hypothetical protein n=1 Tax=Streptomyces mobaraensis TaxID=35621 RepID=UPI001F036513|nr:hypothetical protein [Streptomyces mobaraensis]
MDVVEADAGMLAEAESALASLPATVVRLHHSRAEDFTPPAATWKADLVTICRAFHWMDQQKVLTMLDGVHHAYGGRGGHGRRQLVDRPVRLDRRPAGADPDLPGRRAARRPQQHLQRPRPPVRGDHGRIRVLQRRGAPLPGGPAVEPGAGRGLPLLHPVRRPPPLR